MVMSCSGWAEDRGEVLRKAKRPPFDAMMQDKDDLKKVTKWIISKGWIEQFRLAPQVEALLKARRGPGGSHKLRASELSALNAFATLSSEL